MYYLLALAFVYGVGSSNVGTTLQHRAKLVAVSINVVSPWLPKVRFNSSKALYGFKTSPVLRGQLY